MEPWLRKNIEQLIESIELGYNSYIVYETIVFRYRVAYRKYLLS